MSGTLSEQEEETPPRPVGLVSYVLRYDDLLAGDSMVLPPLGHDLAAIDFGRAAAGAPLRFEAGRLAVPDSYVSSRHARVRRQGVADVVEDLESKHGTFVNGSRVQEVTPLRDGDLIEIGHSLLCYRLVDPEAVPLLVDGQGAPRLGPTRTLSPEIARIAADLRRIAPTDQAVLVLGESGAGKEVVAREVHALSGRRGPFVEIDCGAIPESMLESELFGHRRGSFTGALEDRRGKIRAAHGGTVFLDEIANMSEAAQARLLRVLQDRKVFSVGADSGQVVDVRWLSATNVDVFAEGASFRPDVRARLAGYVAALPPLRRRREDLGILTAHVLSALGVRRASIAKHAARALFTGALRGNVRELEQVLRRATALAGEGLIELRHLPAPESRPALGAGPEGAAPERDAGSPAPQRAAQAPAPQQRKGRPAREEIEAALSQGRGVQGEAARILGVHERQLTRWMDALGIPRGRARH